MEHIAESLGKGEGGSCRVVGSMRRGLGQAASALIIADGAVWIWRRADDRFAHAHQRLDCDHAVQPLAVVGRRPGGLEGVAQTPGPSAQKRVGGESHPATGGGARHVTGGACRRDRAKRGELFPRTRRPDGLPGGVSDGANPSAARRWKPPAASTSVASSVRVNSGAASATRRCSAWKPSGATAAGTCSSPTPIPSTPQKTEKRPALSVIQLFLSQNVRPPHQYGDRLSCER